MKINVCAVIQIITIKPAQIALPIAAMNFKEDTSSILDIIKISEINIFAKYNAHTHPRICVNVG